MVPHTEIFVTQLMEITSFDLVDVSDYVTEVFDLTESEPINVHLESCGYESSFFVVIVGGLIFTCIIVTPVFVVLLLIMIVIFRC